MLSASDLAGKGYFPKELPTPFNSRTFGDALATNPGSLKGNDWRSPIRHTLARPGRIHRALAIPHPQPFAQIAELLQREWLTLDAISSSSPFSLSQPVVDPSRHRSLVTAHHASERVIRRATYASGRTHVVRADVSQFYPSIYTHAIDWAIHGRMAAKAALKIKGAATIGALVDAYVRNAQNGQTMGIPIGPDSSLLLAELVLARVDQEFLARLTPSDRRTVRGFRYFDDYEIFARSRAEADRFGSILQGVLESWQLTINPHKFVVEELPGYLDEPWVATLKHIDVPDANETAERAAIVQLFDEAFRLQKDHRTENVLAYALSLFIATHFEERHVVSRANWTLFEGLILQAALAEPATLPRITHLLTWYLERGYPLDRDSISQTLHAIVDRSGSRGEASELAWACWAAISLRIPLRAGASRVLQEVDDDSVALLCLHAREAGLMPTLRDGRWAAHMNRPGLEGDHWLVAYEALHHRWLKSTTGNDYVRAAPIFGALRGRDVCFYDASARIQAPPLPSTTVSGQRTGMSKADLVRLIESDAAVQVSKILVRKGLETYSVYE
jgi:hypothetical protein